MVFGSDDARDDDTEVYVRDRKAGVTVEVPAGPEQPGGHTVLATAWTISGNGRYVGFVTDGQLVRRDTNEFFDGYRYDLRTGRMRLVSLGARGQVGNSDSDTVVLSWNGRRAAFASTASNLVSGDTNGWYDVYLRNLGKGTTRRASLGTDGAQGNGDSGHGRHIAISGDGLHVSCGSAASNLVPRDRSGLLDVFVWDARRAG